MSATQSEYLSASELHTLTGFTQASKVAAWLKNNALPHKRDGTRVIVSREHVRAWLEGKPSKSSNGPNWAAVA